MDAKIWQISSWYVQGQILYAYPAIPFIPFCCLLFYESHSQFFSETVLVALATYIWKNGIGLAVFWRKKNFRVSFYPRNPYKKYCLDLIFWKLWSFIKATLWWKPHSDLSGGSHKFLPGYSLFMTSV